MFQIPVAKLNDFFAAVAEQEELYLPVDNVAGQAEFKKWEKGDKLSTARKSYGIQNGRQKYRCC